MKEKIKKLLVYFLVTSFILFPEFSFAQSKIEVMGILKDIKSNTAAGTSKDSSEKTKSTSSQSGGGGTFGGGGGFGGGGYQVHVLGQVINPGTYRTEPSVRVAEIVAMAGGVQDGGSLRHIELRRVGKASISIDLFLFAQKGNLEANPFLQDNDVVFIPFASQSVRIEGPVKSNGVYELAGEESVWDIVQLAGGYAAGASDRGDITIVRYHDDKKNLVHVPNVMTELRKTKILGGDIIVIPHMFTKGKEFDYNFAELPADNVFYPSYNSNVFVTGAVSQPGPLPYNAMLSIQEYVNIAGPTQEAKIRSAHIMKANGKIVRNMKKYSISPGDTIIVPNKKLTAGNVLSWYSTFASTVFTGVALKSLAESF